MVKKFFAKVAALTLGLTGLNAVGTQGFKTFMLYAVMAISLITLVLGGIFVVSNRQNPLSEDLTIYRNSLVQEELSLHESFIQLTSVSHLLVKNPIVIQGLADYEKRQGSDGTVSRMVDDNLAAVAAIDNVAAVFLMNLDGTCLYASQEDFIGKDYGFRPYFREAVKNGIAIYPAVGITSRQAGIYYAQLVNDHENPVGVAVLKLKPSFFQLHSITFADTSPPASAVRIGLSAINGIFFNTRDSSLLSLEPLGEKELDALRVSRQFPPDKIQSLGFADGTFATLVAAGFLEAENDKGTDYYLFYQEFAGSSLGLIHVIDSLWFHESYRPASSEQAAYIYLLSLLMALLLLLLFMLTIRHRDALATAETLKWETEQRLLDNNKYETIINQSPQGFWLQEYTTGKILEVNQSLCKLLDLTVEQIVGHHESEFFVERETMQPVAALSLDSISDSTVERQLRLQQGKNKDVLIHSSYFPEPDNGRISGFSFFTDVTERKKEKEQLFLFSKVVEQSTSAIVLTDMAANIIYVNPFFSQLTGYGRAEVLGKKPCMFTAGETDPVLYKEIWQQIKNGETWKGYLRNKRKDGSLYWEGQTIYPLYDEQGEISHFLAIKNDISERLNREREINAQLARLEIVVEHAAVGIAHIVDHHFVWTSNASARMFGYVNGKDTLKLHSEVIFASRESYLDVSRRAEEMFSKNELFRDEQLVRKKDGTLFWCGLTGKAVDPSDPSQGAIWLTIDISRQKEEEEQLLLARERAEQANQAKSDFLANMSHEIRTPMNAIIGMSRLTMETTLDEQQEYYVSTVCQAAESLLGLINSILDFSKIESGRFTLECAPFILEKIITDALQTVDCLAVEKGLSLNYIIDPEVPVFVNGDALRLRQILVNLLNNGIKFTEKGVVSIRVGVDEDREQEISLAFQVQDTGIGIAPDKLSSVFEAFVQADTSASRQFEGTGLGLSICYKLCQMMGGTIRVESTPEQGSSFIFTVLVSKVGEQEVKELDNLVADGEVWLRELRILLVEDNEANRFLAKTMFQKENHQVIEAENGLEALKLLLDHHFDVILMDVQMPVMDGLTAVGVIRACEQGDASFFEQDASGKLVEEFKEALCSRLNSGHIPIVALTAHAMKEDKQCCLDAGMDGYAIKPFNKDEIYRVIQQVGFIGGEDADTQKQQQVNNEKMEYSMKNSDRGLLVEIAEHLENVYSLESAQVEQMIHLSASSLVESFGQAEQAVNDNALDGISAAAHKIKGILLGIGAKDPAAQALVIENMARDGKDAAYLELLQKLRTDLRELLTGSV